MEELKQMIGRMGGILETHNTVLTDVAKEIKSLVSQNDLVIKQMLDVKNGIVPPDLMYRADHKATMEFTLKSNADDRRELLRSNRAERNALIWAFACVIIGILGISAIKPLVLSNAERLVNSAWGMIN